MRTRNLKRYTSALGLLFVLLLSSTLIEWNLSVRAAARLHVLEFTKRRETKVEVLGGGRTGHRKESEQPARYGG
jgi:hypothetical protein